MKRGEKKVQRRETGMAALTDEQLQKVYVWVDEVPLSRPKRNIARDFSDGVLAAELVAHYFPRLVELHNYSPANSQQQKMYNWKTLNNKVFKKVSQLLPYTSEVADPPSSHLTHTN